MNNYQINHGQSEFMILIDITDENLIDYKQFENSFNNLSLFYQEFIPI